MRFDLSTGPFFFIGRFGLPTNEIFIIIFIVINSLDTLIEENEIVSFLFSIPN